MHWVKWLKSTVGGARGRHLSPQDVFVWTAHSTIEELSTVRKLLILSSMVVLVTAISTPSAFAQRDAAAKAKGDMGAFWSSHSNRTVTRSAQPAGESYRSFSYMPAPQPAEVTQQPAEVVQQPAASVQAPAVQQGVVQQPIVQQGVVQQYRSFSYQPATMSRQSVQAVTHHHAWEYAKGDLHRYRN